MLVSMGLAATLLLLAGTPADSTSTPQKFASLLVVASERWQPIAFSQVIIIGLRRGCFTNDAGRATIDDIPPGRWAVRWTWIGYEQRVDTLTFVSGRQETLRIVDPVPARIEPETPMERYWLTPTTGNRLRGRVGVIWTERDTCYFACESDSIPFRTVLSVLPMDSTGRKTSLRIAGRVHDPGLYAMPVFIDGLSRRPAIYRLSPTNGSVVSVKFGLGVLDLRHPVRREGGHWVGDLDDDGGIEVVAVCSGDDRHKVIVRTQRDRKLRWYGGYVVSSDIVPTCTDEDDVQD